MPVEKRQNVGKGASSPVTASPTDAANITARDTDKAGSDVPSGPNAPISHQPIRRRYLLLGVAAVLLLAVVLVFGIPWIRQTLNTVSTDDAYVNGHVTFVAARAPGQVSKVLVDDNYHVKKGDLLIQLDREPYEVAVAIKRGAVDIAKANLGVAEASVRSVEAKARSQYWALQQAIEDVQSRIALLHAKVAAIDKNKANLKFAEAEFERAKALVSSSFETREDYDRRDEALSVARADVTQALEDAYQIRVSLGLPAKPENGGDLGEVPPDLDQTFSSVREAQTELIQSAAELGVSEILQSDPETDGGRIREAKPAREYRPGLCAAGAGDAGRRTGQGESRSGRK